MPVIAVFFGQRAPGREVVECAALPVAERRVGQFPPRRPRLVVQQLEGGPFGRPRAVAVDGVDAAGALLDVRAQPADPAALAQVGEFGDRLDAEINRIDEAPRRRQVRRRLHPALRTRRRRRMQRIHQEVIGAVARRRPHREVGQIGEIPDAPGLPGPHAVELNGQTPGATVAEPLRQPEPIRRHDQRGAGLGVPGTQVHPVIPQRQIGGQQEAGLADPASVQVERRGEVVDLRDVAAHRAVLEGQPHLGGSTVGDVGPKPNLLTGAPDDGRRQPPRPVRPQLGGERDVAFLFVAGRDAERGQHGLECRLGHPHPPAGPVLVLRRDAVPPGEFDQRRCEFGHRAILLPGFADRRPGPDASWRFLCWTAAFRSSGPPGGGPPRALDRTQARWATTMP